MKKITTFLVLIAIIILAYLTFPIWVAIAKAFIGLFFLGLFITGIVVGRLIPRRK
jgi:hypothetical protein